MKPEMIYMTNKSTIKKNCSYRTKSMFAKQMKSVQMVFIMELMVNENGIELFHLMIEKFCSVKTNTIIDMVMAIHT